MVAVVVMVGCGTREEAGTPATPVATTSPVTSNDTDARIVALGDSLTAGLGLSIDQAYPALLQQRLNAKGVTLQVINAGVSGDTSAGGLSRLDWAMQGDVRILIVALGANDGLRGLPIDELKRNLSEIIERAQARGVTVILAGMEAPPNYGRPYAAAFREVYPALAKRYHVQLIPFLLRGVAGDAVLNQRDGIHPSAEGARILADNVWAVLEPVVDQASIRRPTSGS
jgi:acyl-CoA thioesterase-1